MRTRPRPQVTTPFFVWRAIFERLFTDATLSRLKKLTATATPGMGTSNFIVKPPPPSAPEATPRRRRRARICPLRQTAAYWRRLPPPRSAPRRCWASRAAGSRGVGGCLPPPSPSAAVPPLSGSSSASPRQRRELVTSSATERDRATWTTGSCLDGAVSRFSARLARSSASRRRRRRVATLSGPVRRRVLRARGTTVAGGPARFSSRTGRSWHEYWADATATVLGYQSSSDELRYAIRPQADYELFSDASIVALAPLLTPVLPINIEDNEITRQITGESRMAQAISPPPFEPRRRSNLPAPTRALSPHNAGDLADGARSEAEARWRALAAHPRRRTLDGLIELETPWRRDEGGQAARRALTLRPLPDELQSPEYKEVAKSAEKSSRC